METQTEDEIYGLRAAIEYAEDAVARAENNRRELYERLRTVDELRQRGGGSDCVTFAAVDRLGKARTFFGKK